MNSSHICLACRRRLGQARSPLIQWHFRASFISLSGKSRITIDDIPKGDAPRLEDGIENRKSSYMNVLPTRRKRASSINTADELESLFEQSLHPPTAYGPLEASSSLEPYKHVETLKKMMLESYPLGECWSYFVEHFGPNSETSIPKKSRSKPSYFQSTSKNLLKKIIQAKRLNPTSHLLPSISELSRVHLQLGTLNGSEWAEMMLILLENISIIRKSTPEDSPYDDQLILDILGAWNIVSWNLREPRDVPLPGFPMDWSHIPSIALRDAQRIYNKRGPQPMFSLLVPSFQNKALSDIPLVALATYSLLTNEIMISKPQISDAKAFIANLEGLATVLGINFNQVNSRPEGDLVAAFVKESWGDFRKRAAQKTTPLLEEEQELHRVSNQSVTHEPSADRFNQHMSFTNRQLYTAWKQKNINQVEAIWLEVSTWPIYSKKGSSPKGMLSFDLCNYFILSFLGLRQQNRAIEVWNHMVENGMKPTVTTWEAMLSGCKASGDWNSLEQIWQKLLQSGTKPDVRCWTTRISGLMSAKQPELGIRALDEMGRVWLEAAQKQYPQMKVPELWLADDIKEAVKPSIAPVNAAISWLLRNQKQQTAQQILAWASNFGVRPDIVTYNTYLRPLIRNGNIREAIDLLKQMDSEGVKPDVTTFTTVFDETFGKSNRGTPEEQRELIDTVFLEMEQAGVDANLHTYGKIIFRLLRNSNPQISIVNLVLERMAKQGLQPSIHIYTILLEYHFNQNPPNLDAIRSTVERASMVVGVDRTFWDKAIECYAKVGETGAALRILGKLASEKTRIGWIPMRALLQALAENQEWELARSVVRDAIHDADGRLPDYANITESQKGFWRLASDLNLLEHTSDLA